MEPLKPSQETIPEHVKPYTLRNNGNEVYTFITDYAIHYGVRFKYGSSTALLKQHGLTICEFEFLSISNHKPVRDDRVAATIAGVLHHYFDESSKVVVYICDEEGNKRRGAFRQKLFRDWHRQMGKGFEIHQFISELIVNTGSYEFYAGIIYRSDCPAKSLLIPEIEAAAPDVIIAKYYGEADGDM